MSKAQPSASASAPAPAPSKGKGGSTTSKGKGAGPVEQGGSNQSDQQINDMLQHMASGMSWDQLMVDNQVSRRRSTRGKKKKKKFKGSVGNSVNPDVPTTTPV